MISIALLDVLLLHHQKQTDMNLEIGQKTRTGAKITGIQAIVNHGEMFPNKTILAKVATKGKRGAKKTYYVKTSGEWCALGSFGYFEGCFSYDGTTGDKQDLIMC